MEIKEEVGDLSQGPEKVKDSKIKGTDSIKGNRREPVSTRKPGSHLNRRKTEKVLTKDQRISLLQEKKVLNGRAFELAAKNSPGIRELVDIVDIQGWYHLLE